MHDSEDGIEMNADAMEDRNVEVGEPQHLSPPADLSSDDPTPSDSVGSTGCDIVDEGNGAYVCVGDEGGGDEAGGGDAAARRDEEKGKAALAQPKLLGSVRGRSDRTERHHAKKAKDLRAAAAGSANILDMTKHMRALAGQERHGGVLVPPLDQRQPAYFGGRPPKPKEAAPVDKLRSEAQAAAAAPAAPPDSVTRPAPAFRVVQPDTDERKQKIEAALAALSHVAFPHDSSRQEKDILYDRHRLWSLRLYFRGLLEGQNQSDASRYAAKLFSEAASRIQTAGRIQAWGNHYLDHHTLPESQ